MKINFNIMFDDSEEDLLKMSKLSQFLISIAVNAPKKSKLPNKLKEIPLIADINQAEIKGYERRYKESFSAGRRVVLITKAGSRTIYDSCRCIVNEALVGGLVKVGKSYSNSLRNEPRAMVCVKDHHGVFHEITFASTYKGKQISPKQINKIIYNYMLQLKIESKYDSEFGVEQRYKNKTKLPKSIK